MNVELSLTQIAAKLGCSERTALRRIDTGKLAAKKLARGTYLVSLDDIESLAPAERLLRHQQMLTEMDARLQETQRRMDALDARIARIEESSKPTQPIEQRYPAYESRIPQQSAKPPLPEGWTSWNNFMVRHGLRIDDTSIKRLDRHEYTQSGMYAQGRATIKDALDPEGQQSLLNRLRQMAKYHTCEVAQCCCHAAEE